MKHQKINRRTMKDLREELARLQASGQDNSAHAGNIRAELRIRTS